MPHKTVIPQEIIDAMIRLYQVDKYSCSVIGAILGYTTSMVRQRILDANISMRSLSEACPRIKNANYTFFDIIDCEEKAYFLGLLFADGHVRSKDNSVVLKLMDIDVDILKTFSKLIYGREKLTFIDSGKYDNYGMNVRDAYALQITSKHFRSSLINLGCVPQKSLILDFPKNVPDEFMNHFIRGYLDGDGCIYMDGENKCTTSLVSSPIFCRKMEAYINNKLNIESHTYEIGEGNKAYRLHIAGNRQSKTFLDYLYNDATCYLKRKHNSYQKLISIINTVDAKWGTRYSNTNFIDNIDTRNLVNIDNLHKDGLSTRKIGAMYSISHNSVLKIIHNLQRYLTAA